MNKDRQTAPIEKPADGAAKIPSFPPPSTEGRHVISAYDGRPDSVAPAGLDPAERSRSSVPPRDGAAAKRRHALRIPDDEVSRPHLPSSGARGGEPSSEPRLASEPARALTPTRIITISEPQPPPAGPNGSEPDRAMPGGLSSYDPDAEPTTPRAPAALEGEEVEVRFDEESAAAPPAAADREPAGVDAALGSPSRSSAPRESSPRADEDRSAEEQHEHAADVPELRAEDLVSFEPPPARPAAALPPMRQRAMSQPAVLPAPRPSPIPTPKSSLVIVPPHVGSVASQQPESGTGRRKPRLWWEELFNDDYLRATEKAADEHMRREVSFIEESLGVEQGGALLDLACGTGKHAVELARRGYEVVGFDLSLAMLARAGEEAQDAGAKLNFVQGDMREMAFEEQFDGVYCWSTSFGYFEEDKNAQVVARVHRALKAGGSFLLDVANRDFLIRQSPSLAWFEGDGCVCMDEMSVDFITSRLKVKRTMMLDDGRSREIEYSMRIYSLHELGRILHEQGFKVREVSGRPATPGVFFGNESPRAIILAEKK